MAQLCPTLQPHGLQWARPPCPFPSPWVCSNSCPLSQWCHPTTLSIFYHPLLLPPSIFPSNRVFCNESVPCIRWPKYWSFSFSTSPSNEYSGLIHLVLTGLMSLQSKGLSRVFSNTTDQKASFLQHSAFFIVQLSHSYMTTGKTIALTRWNFVCKVMSLLFNMLSSWS